MRSLGSFLLLFGILSSILKLLHVGVYFLILFWVDNWGPDIGWAIRITMIVVGLALMGLSMKKRA